MDNALKAWKEKYQPAEIPEREKAAAALDNWKKRYDPSAQQDKARPAAAALGATAAALTLETGAKERERNTETGKLLKNAITSAQNAVISSGGTREAEDFLTRRKEEYDSWKAAQATREPELLARYIDLSAKAPFYRGLLSGGADTQKQLEETKQKIMLRLGIDEDQFADVLEMYRMNPLESLNYLAGKAVTGAAQSIQGAAQMAHKLLYDDAAILGSLVDATTGGRTNAEEKLQEVADRSFDIDVFGADKLREYNEQLYADKYIPKTTEFLGGLAESAGGMLPAIATGGIAGAAGLSGAVAQGLNYAMFGTGAAGSAAKQALEEGADMQDAVQYGLYSGMLEVLTESMFAGIAGMNESALMDEILDKLSKNGTIRFALDMLGEGAEEGVVAFLEPYIRRATIDPEAAPATAREILESVVSGVALSAIMNGAAAATGGVDAVLGSREGLQEQMVLQDKYGRVEEETVSDALENWKKRVTQSSPATAENAQSDEIPKMELAGPEAFEPAPRAEQQPTEELPRMELAGPEAFEPAPKTERQATDEVPKMELAGPEAFETKGEVTNAEISDRGRERDAGVDSRGQAERVYPQRSGQAGLAAARADKAKAYVGVSPREYGVENGSEEAEMKIIPAEDYDGELESISKALEGLGVKNHHFVVGGIKVKDPVSGETRSVNAVYNDATGTMIVRADSRLYTARQLALHETFHYFAAQDAELREEAFRRLSAEMEEGELDELITRYQVTYGNIYGDNEDAYIDEILADAYAGINRSGHEADRYSKQVRSAVAEMRNRPETQRQQTNGPNQRYSIKNTSQMTLEKQLNAYYNNKMASSDAFYFGQTPEILKEAGIDSLPLAFTTSDFKKTTREKHNVPRRVIKNLQNDLQNALFTFAENNRIGVVTDDIDGDGKPLIIAIEKNVQMDNEKVNAIRSAYGLDNPSAWLKNQIEQKKQFTLLDEKRANTFLYPYGYSASRKEGIRSIEGTISQDAPKVKQNYSIDDEDDIRSEAFEAERERTELETALNQDVIDQVNEERIKEIERKAREKAEKQGLDALKSARRRLGAEIRELTEGVDEPSAEQRQKYREKKAELAVYSEAVKARTAELSAAAEKKAAKEKVTPKRAIGEVRKELMKEFSTASENRREMGDIIEWYANKALESGKLTRKGRNALFDRLTSAGLFKEAADQYYEQIYRALKKTKIYVPQDVISALGSDWNQLRKTAFGSSITLTKDPEATHIDVLARDMESIFGIEFANDTDRAYQLRTIIEYADEGRGENVTFAERLARIENQYGIEEAEAYVERMQEKIDFAFEKFAEKAGIEIEYAQKQKATQALKTTVSADARKRLRDNYERKHKEEQTKHIAHEEHLRQKFDDEVQAERLKHLQQEEKQREKHRAKQDAEKAKHIAHEEYLRQKYNDEVESERLEHRIQEYEQRQEYKSKLEEEKVKHMAQEERQRREQRLRLAEERVRHEDMLRRAAERRQASELRQKTLRSLHRLKSLQQKQGSAEWNAKVDAEMQRLTGVTLDDINTFTQSVAKETNYSKKYEATWGDLANMYREAKANDPNFIPSKDLEEIVHRLDGLSIKSLDVDALQDIFTAAAQLWQEFYDAKHLRIGNEDMAISEAFTEIVDEIKQSGEKARRLGAVEGLYNWEQLTPMSIFERMGGWNKNSLWYKFAQSLESGERKAKEYKVKSEAMLEEFIRNNREWIKRADGQGKDAIWYEKTAYTITNPDPLRALKLGEDITKGQEYTIHMTPMMKVHMYLESKNYDNLRHMAGGRVFPDKKLYSQGKRTEAFEEKGTTVRLEPEQVRALCSDLTQQERELADILERYYNGYASEEINKVSNILYGYDKAATKNYAPIFVATNYTGTNWEVNENATVEGIGRMKERIQSSLPSYSISAIDAFEKHVTDTARWVGLAIPTHNMNKLLNWQIGSESGPISLKDTITRSFGKKGFDAVRGIMKNIASPAWNENSDIDSIMEKLTSQYISSTFAFNPSVVLKQVGSMWTAASELGFGNMVLGTFSRSDSKLIEKYTPELAYRMLGYATPELKYLREHPNKLETSKVGKFLFRGGAITWMDGMAAKALWPAAVRYVKENYSDLEIGDAAAVNAGTSPFYQKVAEVFNDAVTRTQSMSDAMHSALITKKGPGSKALTMFKTDSMQTYNLVRRNWGEMRYWQEESKRLEAAAQKNQNLAAAAENAKSEAKAATKKMSRTITAILCSNLYVGAVSFLIALLKNGAKYYRDEDDELTFESVAAEFAKNIAQNAAGIFVLGEEMVDVADRLVKTIKKEAQFWSYDLVSSLTFDQVNAFIEAAIEMGGGVGRFIANAINAAREGGSIEEYFKRNSGELLGIIESGLETVGVIFGVPVKNFRDYILGTLGLIAPEAKVAYEDATNIPTKADMTGTAASAAPLRVEHIYSARGVELSEAASAELARLYQAGYKDAVISDTPSKFEIKGVEFELTASQQQTYDRATAEIINAELANVLDSEVYAMANDEQKEKIITALYKYAKETGKWETAKAIYQAAEPETRAEIGEYEQTANQIKCNALREAGIPLVYLFAMQVLGDENDNDNLAQDEAEKWLRAVALEKNRKAAVWQAHNKQWSPKNNPFNKTTGKTIYQKLIEDAEALAD